MLQFSLTMGALIAFAANSILCRMALADGDIDALSFSLLRLASGALSLPLLLVLLGHMARPIGGNWFSALMLMLYVISFSLAYLSLSAASGALILFAAVQFTMVLGSMRGGTNPNMGECFGMAMALGGLVYLLFPGLETPSLTAASLMLLAGMSWGVYSLRGGGADPLLHTSGNFIRALGLFVPLLLFMLLLSPSHLPITADIHLSSKGILLAVASGALASGLGYALWYAALKTLKPLRAGLVQLSVPVLTAFAGAALLSEPLTLHLLTASILILGGIFLGLMTRPAAEAPASSPN